MNQDLKRTLPHGVIADDAERVAHGRSAMRPPSDYTRTAEIFRSLGDPSRVKIVDALLRQELCTGDLAELLGLSEPAISQHLRVLRMLRVVSSHRHGHRVFHTLDDEHVRNLLELTMEHVRDTLERAAPLRLRSGQG
jgi:DNA-binding transcriptional ArsR family regulator